VQRLLPSLVPGPDQEDLRGFEWFYLWRQAHGHRLSIPAGNNCTGVALVENGKTLLVAGDGQVAAHDPASGKKLATLTSGKAGWAWLLPAPDGRVRVLRAAPNTLEVLEHTSAGLRLLRRLTADINGL
jgi:hypothetical protein